MTLGDLAKYSMTWGVARSFCDSWASRHYKHAAMFRGFQADICLYNILRWSDCVISLSPNLLSSYFKFCFICFLPSAPRTSLLRFITIITVISLVRACIAVWPAMSISEWRFSGSRCHDSKTILTIDDVISCVCWTRLFSRPAAVLTVVRIAMRHGYIHIGNTSRPICSTMNLWNESHTRTSPWRQRDSN